MPRFVANREITPTPGVRDLAEGELTATYSLGAAGTKTVRFRENEIVVEVRHEGSFTEQIPLLVGPGDTLRHDDQAAVLTRFGKSVRIVFDEAGDAEVSEHGIGTEGLNARVIRLTAADRLRYRLVFDRLAP
ncbi:MAG: hypothetical protein ACRD2X_15720 [Vicinamibacteraceae bacterium]